MIRKISLLPLLLAGSIAAAQETRKGPSCGDCGKETYGTSIQWVGSPSEASKKAKADEKLVFLLHVSGNFEDPRFT